jgi:hypothetical protein
VQTVDTKNQGRRFGGGQAIYHQRAKQEAERVDRSLSGLCTARRQKLHAQKMKLLADRRRLIVEWVTL